MGEIHTDDDYFALLDRIVKGAYYLARPNIAPQEYDRGIKLYDELCKKAWNYRWGGDENDKKHWYTETY